MVSWVIGFYLVMSDCQGVMSVGLSPEGSLMFMFMRAPAIAMSLAKMIRAKLLSSPTGGLKKS